MTKGFKLDFVGIGAPRTGTTWISTMLEEHPEICMADQKEIHFFSIDKLYNSGSKYLSDRFTHCNKLEVLGEWSVDYLYSKEAAKRIYKHNPNIKILVCLRDPIERAYSHFLLQKYSAVISPFYSFTDAVSGSDKHSYIERGRYARYLQHYLSIFPKENVKVIIYEEFTKNPKESIKSIYAFLRTRTDFTPRSLEKNIDYRSKNKFRSLILESIVNKLTFLYKKSGIKKFLRIIGVRYILNLMHRLNYRSNLQKFEKPDLEPETIVYLKERYANDIERLETLLGRKIEVWC